jgi:GNAT superfamily N-acetyltransferase
MNSPATSRVGNGGCPGPTRHTELKRRARKSQSISPASRTSGWRKLMISSRGGRNRSSWRSSRGWLIGLPPTANLAVEGITDHPNRESQTARKPACTPGFLAKSITCSGQIIAIDQSLPSFFTDDYDGSNDECVGWAFLVKRQGYADIEELFVRPAYRGKRYGSQLAELIKSRPEFADRPLRLWVGHTDREAVNTGPFRKIVKRLGLSVNRASKKWVPYVGM